MQNVGTTLSRLTLSNSNVMSNTPTSGGFADTVLANNVAAPVVVRITRDGGHSV